MCYVVWLCGNTTTYVNRGLQNIKVPCSSFKETVTSVTEKIVVQLTKLTKKIFYPRYNFFIAFSDINNIFLNLIYKTNSTFLLCRNRFDLENKLNQFKVQSRLKWIKSRADLLQRSRRKLPLRRTSHHTDTNQHVIPLHWQTVNDELTEMV